MRWLAGNATERLDIIAQYWQLLAQPSNPKSGDYGYSAVEMKKFGADEGRAVYTSLEDAADRNVSLRSPLSLSVEIPHVNGYPALSDPFMFHIPFETPGTNFSSMSRHSSYLSFAPPEVIFSKHATVNILVAYWTHFIEGTDQYLKSLIYSNVLCLSSKRNHCRGQVNIKYYKVPGYDKTGAALSKKNATGSVYPGYTRVNHGKYAVSDVRAHIGTSNLIWDYFYTTAGVSFGTYHPALVAQLQEIFDADWNSQYAVPVEPLLSDDGASVKFFRVFGREHKLQELPGRVERHLTQEGSLGYALIVSPV
ncbi:hypothetical protein BHE74_00041481 [Ensete ventricosum]|nr:hypothetical protein BHE74_00041481 [Ensete ventricosum]